MRIPKDTTHALPVADLFLSYYERDFMSHIHKSQRIDIIDLFNVTSAHFNDMLTIINNEFEKHISAIYPQELELKKENTSKKIFFYLIIKVIDDNIHTSVYNKRNGFWLIFLSLISPGLVVMSLDSHHTVSYIVQLVRCTRCFTSVLDFHFKNLQISS